MCLTDKLRAWFGFPQVSRSGGRRRRAGLFLEPLEDRAVPAVLTVTSALDPAAPLAGTLRFDINHANAGDTIDFDTGIKGIQLVQGVLEVKTDVTINGAGQVVIDGQGATTIFMVDQNVNVVINGLTIRHGSASRNGVPSFGGGIINAGNLQLNASTVTGNTGGDGGGIENLGTGFLTASQCTFSGNSASGTWGGAITNQGFLQVKASTFSGNTALTSGGAVENTASGHFSAFNCTFSGNSVTGQYGIGGAITNGGTLYAAGCTISANSAAGFNGDVGGLLASGPTTLVSTIVAGNLVGPNGTSPDIRGVLGPSNTGEPSHNNLIGDGTGMSGISNGDANHNLVGTKNSVIHPGLSPLANNGGPTQTMALAPGSPAVHKGAPVGPTDQRGFPNDNPPDIGAYQIQPAPAPTLASFTVSAPSLVNAGVGFNVVVTAKDQNGNTLSGYNGPATLTSSDGQTVFAPNPITLTNGTATVTVTLDRANILTLTASAGTIHGASGAITVHSGAAASIQVSAPSTATAGVGFPVTITVLDVFGSVYTGPVNLTCSDGQAVSPATVQVVNGTAVVNVTLQTADTVRLTATSGHVSGVSGSITVNPVPTAPVQMVGGTHQALSQVVFSADSQHLAFVAQDATGQTVYEDGNPIGGAHQAIAYLQFSANGQHLAFVAQDGTGYTIYEDGKALLSGANQPISTVHFSPDSLHLAFVAQGGMVPRDFSSDAFRPGKRSAVLNPPSTGYTVYEDDSPIGGTHQAISYVQFSSDSRHLAFVAQDGTGYTAYEDGKVIGGAHQTISSLQFSPDGQHLAFVAQDNMGNTVYEDGNLVGGVHHYIYPLLFSANSQHLAFLAVDGTISTAYEDGRLVGGAHQAISSFQFSPDGQHLAFVAQDGASQSVYEDGKLLGGPHKGVYSILFSPDGQHLAYLVSDGLGYVVYEDGNLVGGSHTSITNLLFSPDSRHLVFVAHDSFAMVYEDGKAVGGAHQSIGAILFSPNGAHLAFTAYDGTVATVYEDGTTIGGTHSLFSSIQFSPDSQHLAFVAVDGTSQTVYEDGKAIGGAHQSITDILFSSDSQHLAFTAQDGTVATVVEDGQLIGGTHQSIADLLFSQNGRHLAFAAKDANGEAVFEANN